MTPWTVAHQAPLSIGFSRQEYWSRLPCPPPGHLPDPGIEPRSPVSPAMQVDSSPAEPARKPEHVTTSWVHELLKSRWAVTRSKIKMTLARLGCSSFVFFLKIFFGCGPLLKPLLSLLQYCFCFMSRPFDREPCGVLPPRPRTELADYTGRRSRNRGPPGGSLLFKLTYI